jgi:hypothetical protein
MAWRAGLGDFAGLTPGNLIGPAKRPACGFCRCPAPAARTYFTRSRMNPIAISRIIIDIGWVHLSAP